VLNIIAILAKTVLLIFAVIFCGDISSAQDNIDEWGIGIISRTDFANKSETVNFPPGDNFIYDKPNGRVIGFINKSTEYRDPIFEAIHLEFNGNKNQKMNRADFKEINYEGGCLKYYEERDGFVRVLKYTYNSEVWISIDSLNAKGYMPLSWPEFMFKQKTFFVLPKNEIIMLKLSPDTNSQTITKLDSDRFHITITGEHKNNWFKVTVKEYSQYYLEVQSETPLIYEGWLQAIDNNGHPIIWYYTRGC